MHIISFITWDISPEIFSLGSLSIRWYGLLFACGFLIGQQLMAWFFKMEGKGLEDQESLLVWMVASTILGARLGHCLFYEPAYYLAHPLDILKVWEGGLASHGATVAILLGIYLFAKKRFEIETFTHKILKVVLYPFELVGLTKLTPPVPSPNTYSWLYLLDRLVIIIALAGCFIRLGNLMNSEIVGLPTLLPWGFIFVRNLTVEGLPENFARHPSQLYEAIFCLLLFGLLLMMYLRYKAATPYGRLLGWFVVLLFTQRILVEFTKENQVAFENYLPLNMGQILSIPFILMGAYVLYRSYTKPLTI